MSYSQIAGQLGVSLSVVKYAVDRLRNRGLLPPAEVPAMSDTVVVKVERDHKKYWTRYGTLKTPSGTSQSILLDEEIKGWMGGDDVAYFQSMQKDGKWILQKRVPNQSW